MHPLHIIQPSELLHPADGTVPDFAPFRYKFLAQGDSWFSIGAVPPTGTIREALHNPRFCTSRRVKAHAMKHQARTHRISKHIGADLCFPTSPQACA